ncbi:ATP-dependent DNA ligase [Agromyces bauzanensis]
MGLPEEVSVPPPVELARSVRELPSMTAMPGGTRYEPKWDGFRAVIVVDEDVSLWSRQGKNLTRSFPDLTAAAASMIPAGCIVDGEAVIWIDGRLSFEALQQRLGVGTETARRLAHAQPASYVAFDLIAVAGQDVRHLRLDDRRGLLEKLAEEWTPPLNLSPVTADIDEAREWLETMPAVGIEGIIAKGAGQEYAGGVRDWVKVKRYDTLDVVLAAVIGPREQPETIVVGLPDGNELRIVGRSTPLQPHQSRYLGMLLRPPARPHPWPEVVSPGALGRFNAGRDLIHLTLVEPIVAEVSADVATSGRSFRHLVKFVRLRPELDVDQVVWPSR